MTKEPTRKEANKEKHEELAAQKGKFDFVIKIYDKINRDGSIFILFLMVLSIIGSYIYIQDTEVLYRVVEADATDVLYVRDPHINMRGRQQVSVVIQSGAEQVVVELDAAFAALSTGERIYIVQEDSKSTFNIPIKANQTLQSALVNYLKNGNKIKYLQPKTLHELLDIDNIMDSR